jgi:RNA 2',3'-cyclic 3'-phosphodiesterase
VRLFVGVDTGPEVASAIAAIVAELKPRASRLAPMARLTWAKPEHVHLTLRFIGEVDAARAATLAQAFERGVPLAPFTVEVGGLGVFPDRGQPRVLWVGLTGGVETMTRLEDLVSTRLLQAGVPRDERPFRPHVTVARVRDAADLRPAALFQGLADATIGTITVSSFTLFESRQTPGGVEYLPLVQSRLACQPVA